MGSTKAAQTWYEKVMALLNKLTVVAQTTAMVCATIFVTNQ